MPGMVSVVLDEHGQAEELSRLAGFDTLASGHLEGAMRAAVAMGRVKVVAELRSAAEANRGAMLGELGEEMQPLAPVNARVPEYRITSMTQNQGQMNIVGIVGDMNRKYLRLTEDGRGPGRHPPARVLQDWAEEVLGVQPGPERTTKKGRVIRDLSAGRAIAHAIAKKGIKGTPTIEKSAAAVEGHVMALFETELLKIAAELGYR